MIIQNTYIKRRFEDLLLYKFNQRFQSRYYEKYTEKIKRQKHTH